MAVSWSAQWRTLLRVDDATARRQVVQGRAYHRSGRVTGVRVATGRLSGRVQGHRATPRAVDITVALLDDGQWGQVVDVLAAQLRHSARLLAGLQPEGLAEELETVGVSLLPAADDVAINCGCGQGQPCAHAAGVWEASAELIEDDPFALLRLRGRGRERLLAEVAAARGPRGQGGQDTPDDVLALDELDAKGWSQARSRLEELHLPDDRHAPGGAVPLQLLGDPPGWPAGPRAEELFGPLVERAARWARQRTDD